MTIGRRTGGAYQDWVDWLDAYGRGEERSMSHLVPHTDDLGPDYLSRLVDRVAAAFQTRLDRWNDVLSRDLRAATTPTGYAAAMVSARQRLDALRRLTDCTLLPEPVRTGLAAALSTVVDQVQESLTEAAHRAGPALLAVVRDHDLRRLAAPPLPPTPVAARPDGPVRRVII